MIIYCRKYLQNDYILQNNIKTCNLLSTPTSFSINIYFCGIMFLHIMFRFYRYLQPPSFWVVCSLESRELMALCLKRLKNLSKVKLIDAIFVWTEPHSKRIKVRIWTLKMKVKLQFHSYYSLLFLDLLLSKVQTPTKMSKSCFLTKVWIL